MWQHNILKMNDTSIVGPHYTVFSMEGEGEERQHTILQNYPPPK